MQPALRLRVWGGNPHGVSEWAYSIPTVCKSSSTLSLDIISSTLKNLWFSPGILSKINWFRLKTSSLRGERIAQLGLEK